VTGALLEAVIIWPVKEIVRPHMATRAATQSLTVLRLVQDAPTADQLLSEIIRALIARGIT